MIMHRTDFSCSGPMPLRAIYLRGSVQYPNDRPKWRCDGRKQASMSVFDIGMATEQENVNIGQTVTLPHIKKSKVRWQRRLLVGQWASGSEHG